MSTIFTKCPNCGVGVEPDIVSCQSCKSPIPPVSYGLVVCPTCNKIVPDTRYCIYCGTKISYNLTERQRSILISITERAAPSTPTSIHKHIDGSKESIRTNLSHLRRDRLVDTIKRGEYTITSKARRALKKDNIVVTEAVSELTNTQPATILDPHLGTSLLRDRATELNISYLRIKSDAPDRFVSILEHLANKIAKRAVELANGEEVDVKHIEQAIGEIKNGK